VENDTNYLGPAVSAPVVLTSLEDCQRICVQNPDCTRAIFSPVDSVCTIKTKDSYAYQYAGLFSVPKYCPGFGKHVQLNLVVAKLDGIVITLKCFLNKDKILLSCIVFTLALVTLNILQTILR